MPCEGIIRIRISRKGPLNGSIFSSRKGKFIHQFMELGGTRDFLAWPELFRKMVLSINMFCDLGELKFYRCSQCSDKPFLRYFLFLITSLIIMKTRHICVYYNPNLVRKEQKGRLFLSLSCKHSCLLLVNSSDII